MAFRATSGSKSWSQNGTGPDRGFPNRVPWSSEMPQRLPSGSSGKGEGTECGRSVQPLQQSLFAFMPRPCSENGRPVLGTSCFCTPATTCSCGAPCATHRKSQDRESQIREDTEEEVVPRGASVNHAAPSRPTVGSRGLGGAVHTSGHQVGV